MRIAGPGRGSVAVTALVVGLVVGLLAGCSDGSDGNDGNDGNGDDGPPAAAPASPGPSESSEQATSSVPEPSESAVPTESPTASPSVPPADGPTLRTADGVSVRVPRGFDSDAEGDPEQARISRRESDLSQITFSTRTQVGEPGFEVFKEISLESTPSSIRLRVQPDRELLGQPAYHFSGRLNPYQRIDQFGVVSPDGIVISLEFWTLSTDTPAQRAEIIEPVLASIQVG